MVACRLDPCGSVMGPFEVVSDADTEDLEAADPLCEEGFEILMGFHWRISGVIEGQGLANRCYGHNRVSPT